MRSNNKCPSCACNMVYEPKHNCIICSSCGKKIPIDNDKSIESHDYEANKNKYSKEWSKNNIQVNCSNCGASYISTDYSLINKCSYCGGTNLVEIDNLKTIEPDGIIPFQFNVEEAKKYFETNIKSKMFIPNVLKKQLPTLNVVGRYASVYVFDANAIINYAGKLKYETTSKDDEGNTVVSEYTKNVSGTMQDKLENYIIESSSNLSQFEFALIGRFDLSYLKPFSSEYLFGYSADYSDRSLEDANSIFERDFKSRVTKEIKNKHHADDVVYLNMDINFLNKKYTYCLLPIYIFDYDYKGNHYKTLMNGVTGKLGGGVPRSTAKILTLIFSILFFMFGFGLLIFLLM